MSYQDLNETIYKSPRNTLVKKPILVFCKKCQNNNKNIPVFLDSLCSSHYIETKIPKLMSNMAFKSIKDNIEFQKKNRTTIF